MSSEASDAGNESTKDYRFLTKQTFFVGLIIIFVRIMIVATRHGTTPIPTYRLSEMESSTEKTISESLISIAWVIVTPELLTIEIEKGLKRLGIT